MRIMMRKQGTGALTSAKVEPTRVFNRVIEDPNYFSITTNDRFGSGVGIIDNTLIASAPHEDIGGSNQGIVYVIDLNTDTVTNTIYDASETTLGYNIAAKDDYAVFGTSQSNKVFFYKVSTNQLTTTDVPGGGNLRYVDTCNGKSVFGNQGSYNIYVYDNVTMTQLMTFVASPLSIGYGNRVVINTNYVATSDYSNEKVMIYDMNTESLFRTINNPDLSGNYTLFGYYLGMDETYIAISAGIGTPTRNRVHLYEIATGNLIHTFDNPNQGSDTGSDYFGVSIKLHRDKIYIGAEYEDNVGGDNEGAVYVFDMVTGDLVDSIFNPGLDGNANDDDFGHSLAVNDNYLIIGANNEEDSNAGAGKVYIYD